MFFRGEKLLLNVECYVGMWLLVNSEIRDAATLTQQDSITRTTLHYAANIAAFTRVLYCKEFLSYTKCVLWVGPSLVTSRRKKLFLQA